MLQRTYEQARQARCVDEVLVAIDDARARKDVLDFGGQVVLTGTRHRSGTDRCAEAVDRWEGTPDAVLNLQADEPFLPPAQIDRVVRMLQAGADIATIAHPIRSEEELWSSAAVKVVLDRAGRALYFSRSPIPHLRDVPKGEWLRHHTFYRHIGLYGFRTGVLRRITRFLPGQLEEGEKLEQLRWMEGGLSIQVGIVREGSLGMDTPADLERAKQWLASGSFTSI
jgi:3-deoxy-manno-octulosonate cytidylyltransferase (CMP-KDO synthetase)